MAREIPERYVWAVDIIDVRPNDLILEIGCGYGHSIPLIAPKLCDGHLTLIDRSEKMAAAAKERAIIERAEEKVSVLHADLLSNDFPENSFDKIFLFNINAFWMDPVAELVEIRRLVGATGKFYLFHQPPPGHELLEFENAFIKKLTENGFEKDGIHHNSAERVNSLGIVAHTHR